MPNLQAMCSVLRPPLSIHLQLCRSPKQNVVLPVCDERRYQLHPLYIFCVLLLITRRLWSSLYAGIIGGYNILRSWVDTYMHFREFTLLIFNINIINFKREFI